MQKQNRLTNPRGLRADAAAEYLGMGRTKFLELVNRAMLPRPVLIDGLRVWDRLDLDAAFDTAKEDTPTENNSFDKIMGR
jgi:predicted DNA-binding transcriptional regulator AlpA